MRRVLVLAILGGLYSIYLGGALAIGTTALASPARTGLGGIGVTAPTWWAVPSLVLGSMGKQVARVPMEPSTSRAPDGRGDSAAEQASTDGDGALLPEVAPQQSTLPPVLLPQRRFTVLLLGSDNDLKFPANAVLTQSMILVSIDPVAREVAMISIPRDFWVPIQGYGNAKIDVAYEVGGIALARSTVERQFGIPIDYYAWVGLSGLVQVIDSLGGIDVTVQHPVLDEAYPDDLNTIDPYAYFRLYIPSGLQHLDGVTALEYVRSRHGDFESDFGRSRRQQQVLLAIKKLMTGPTMVAHVPDLAAALGDSVQTDLSLSQVVQLAALARGIAPSQIHQLVLAAPQYASLGYSPDQLEQIVIPNWQAIRPAVAALVQTHTAVADAAGVQDPT